MTDIFLGFLPFRLFALEVMHSPYRLHWVAHSLRSLHLVTDISDDLDVGQRIDVAAMCLRQRPKSEMTRLRICRCQRNLRQGLAVY